MRRNDWLFGPEAQKHVDISAREIAGNQKEPLALSYARDIARADLQLLRVKHLQVALIERIRTFGSLASTPEPPMLSARTIRSWGLILEATGRFCLIPPDIEATMPQTEPERTAVAISRCLQELNKLDRYARRALASRNRAVRQFQDFLPRLTDERV